jgi:glycosyltransferase involved in cell wall biosynthesis
MGRDMVRINFLVNEVFDGWEPTDVRLGGTERAVVEWAEELARRGHELTVFRNGRGKDYWHNDVLYADRNEYTPMDIMGGVYINVKCPEIKRLDYPMIFYTNDVDADKQDLSAYDAVIHISQYAKDNIPVNNDNVFIVPHGYDDKLIYPGKKIPKQCFYASSPDRGLDTLLEAWPKVVEQHPDATLLVTYGGTGPALPGVMYMGELSEEEMADIYRTSDVWCHPCSGGELFCITGIKAQAAGCVPVIIPTMALAETVRHGYFAESAEDYAVNLIEALNSTAANDTLRVALDKEHYPTIVDSTDELLKVIEKVYNKA